MEKNSERVLAYQLAKEIDIATQSEISGGSGIMCQHTTLHPTGNEKSLDATIEMSIDW